MKFINIRELSTGTSLMFPFNTRRCTRTAVPKYRQHRSDSAIGKSFAAKANANQRKWVEIDSPLSTVPDRFAFISVDLRLNLL